MSSLTAGTPPLLLSTPEVWAQLQPYKTPESRCAPSSLSWPGGHWAMSPSQQQTNQNWQFPEFHIPPASVAREHLTGAWNVLQWFFPDEESGHVEVVSVKIKVCTFVFPENRQTRKFAASEPRSSLVSGFWLSLCEGCWNMVLPDSEEQRATRYKCSRVLKESNECHKSHGLGSPANSQISWVILSSEHHVVLHGENPAAAPPLSWQLH